MKKSFKFFLKYIRKNFYIKVSTIPILRCLIPSKTLKKYREFLSALDPIHIERAKYFLRKSKSQLFQDIFVLTELNYKKSGFFVEVGASSGIILSNTYLLEKEFDWKGILSEPAQIWHEELTKNRKAKIDFDGVWNKSGKCINFTETRYPLISTISEFNSSDMHWEARKQGKTYTVNTVSLMDLLKRHNAPHQIDYLTLDTEGSEFEIIKDFDFDAYSISIITCEHNFTENRKKIYDLLTSKGFVRKFEQISDVDDWYARN